MRKWHLFLFSILLFDLPILATEIYKVPILSEKEFQQRAIVKENLLSDTIVQHYSFSVLAPKGWSINPVGPSERMRASVTITPTSDLENEKTYIGVHSLKTSQEPDLNKHYAKMKREKPNWTLSFNIWNGNKWLSAEYVESLNGIDVKRWAAFTVVNTHEHAIVAGTPLLDSKKYGPTLIKIMESVVINK